MFFLLNFGILNQAQQKGQLFENMAVIEEIVNGF